MEVEVCTRLDATFGNQFRGLACLGPKASTAAVARAAVPSQDIELQLPSTQSHCKRNSLADRAILLYRALDTPIAMCETFHRIHDEL